jgi:hypothetical protein
MTPRIDEVATDLFRISLYVPQFDLQFNHFLIRDEEPLLFHTGLHPASAYAGCRPPECVSGSRPGGLAERYLPSTSWITRRCRPADRRHSPSAPSSRGCISSYISISFGSLSTTSS